MTLVHDHPTAGHLGQDKTIWQAKNHLSWPGMNHWIAQYVKGCTTCQQNKILFHRTKIPLYQISTLVDAHPFQQVSMDLITGLPKVHDKDAILTIVDHGCSRAAIFLPCATTITSPGIATLYLKNVYPWFGLPKKIITDKDPQFTLHFSRVLTTHIGAQQNTSTAFYPQTDGLSEWKNQWVKQYLCTVTSASPEDWTSWLSITSAIHNNRQNDTTGLLPNQILWGHEAMLVPNNNFPIQNQMAEDCIEDVKRNQQIAISVLNKKAGKVPALSLYRVENQVWLEATHLHLPYQSTKLAPKHHGPFLVTKEVSPVAFQLCIPMAWNIHDIFHASLLSPYRESPEHGPNYSRPLPDLLEGEEEYKVE
jgi:integrase-like protein